MQVDIKQNTQEWYRWRSDKLGASDYAALAYYLQHDKPFFPSRTINYIIIDKLYGTNIKDNKYYKIGKMLEPIIFDRIRDVLGIENLKTGVCFEKDNFKYIIASLDALADNLVIEVKITTRDVERHDELIDYYREQVVHQMICADKKRGMIVTAFLERDLVDGFINGSVGSNDIIVDFDYDFINLTDRDVERHDHNCKIFFDLYNKELSNHDHNDLIGVELSSALNDITELEAKVANLKNILQENEAVVAGNYKISKVKRCNYDHFKAYNDAIELNKSIDKVIDYKKTLELNNIDYKKDDYLINTSLSYMYTKFNKSKEQNK